MLATGDLKNSVARLRKLLKAVRYPHALTNGASAPFSIADLLRILHYALLDYSRHVAAFVLEKGYDLYGKTDARFIDHCFRLMRDEFQYFPSLNATQFLSNQFLERKIQLVAEILDVVVKKHDESVRRRRQEQAVWVKPRELKTDATHVENHVMPPPVQTASTPAIDTWSLLEHLRQEAKQKAREQKRAAAQRVDQRRQVTRTWLNGEAEPGFRELSPQREPSPSNQRAQSDSTESHSETEPDRRSTDNQRTSAVHTTTACACGCADTKAEVRETLVTLSQQISDLTSAVLSRVSTIELRLGRVEQQLQDLQVSPPFQRNHETGDENASTRGRFVPVSRTKAAQCSAPPAIPAAGNTVDAAARSRREEVSWPPDPALFQRY